jgi:hypothetical protein
MMTGCVDNRCVADGGGEQVAVPIDIGMLAFGEASLVTASAYPASFTQMEKFCNFVFFGSVGLDKNLRRALRFTVSVFCFLNSIVTRGVRLSGGPPKRIKENVERLVDPDECRESAIVKEEIVVNDDDA